MSNFFIVRKDYTITWSLYIIKKCHEQKQEINIYLRNYFFKGIFMSKLSLLNLIRTGKVYTNVPTSYR